MTHTMLRGTRILTVLLLVQFCHLVIAQSDSPTAPTLAEMLSLNFNPPNEIAFVLFGGPIVFVQTPIAVRYALVLGLPTHEVLAACHPVVLSFFGTKDPIPSKFCKTRQNRLVLASFIQYRVLLSQFPREAVSYGQFLKRLGLNPFTRSTDRRTMNGWADFIANRLNNYLENDGWNSLGDATRMDFRQPYSDSSGYKPQNPAFLPASDLRRPLRWQPLTGEVDQRGNFGSQVHVVPHLAQEAMPLVLSSSELEHKRAHSPYATPNKWRAISPPDRRKVLRLIRQLFKTSVRLTSKQVALAHWWENKFISLGIVLVYYRGVLKIDEDVNTRLFLGDMLAQHDAALTAWKEKIRHDLVRPTTMIRRLLRGKLVRAYKGFGKGVGLVKAEEWEPVVPVQPHSEFPSASALICKASLEHLQLALNNVVLGKNETLPPFEQVLTQATVPTSPVDFPVKIKFFSLDELARSCGMSRLHAGVHFAPSVLAGFELGQGIGDKSFRHVSDLYAGTIPKDCTRCLRS